MLRKSKCGQTGVKTIVSHSQISSGCSFSPTKVNPEFLGVFVP